LAGIPGWNTIEGASAFSRGFSIAGFVALFLLGIFEILAYLYSNRKDNLIEAQKQFEQHIAPYRQPIRSASATVEVFIQSDESLNTTFMDRGGYLAFVRGTDPVLITAGRQSDVRQLGSGRLLFGCSSFRALCLCHFTSWR